MQHLVTTTQACEMLAVSRSTIHKLATSGKLTKVIISARAVRFTAESVRALIAGGISQ